MFPVSPDCPMFNTQASGSIFMEKKIDVPCLISMKIIEVLPNSAKKT
jgi:hypothetical protein